MVSAALWLGIGYTSWLVVANSLPYFLSDGPHLFLQEKGGLTSWLPWRAAFVAHVGGALVCLLTGPVLFCRPLMRRAPAVHRLAGRVYVMAVLAWSAPAGLFLSLFAKGGLPGRSGFLVLGVMWVICTWHGYRTARARQFRLHARWMAHSFALATSALSFRVFQFVLVDSGLNDPPTAYVSAIWLSLLASVALGAWWARKAGPAPRPRKTVVVVTVPIEPIGPQGRATPGVGG